MNNLRRRVENSSGVVLDHITGRGIVDGYEVVDLGLPSGLLWVTCNVGVSRESGYGNYYQWGAGATTYKNEDQYHTGATDTDYILPSSVDTTTQVMGTGWRMPTKAELEDLINKTNYYWVSYNGLNGCVFESDRNVLFFPPAGCYKNGSLDDEGRYSYVWSSTAGWESAYNLESNN